MGLTGHQAPFLCQVAALKEARLSFPSGHASTAFATMTVLALYLAGKIGMFHRVCCMKMYFGRGSFSALKEMCA